ncbi:DeoR/GlpR family DNA-binding transcription regulator [Muricomes intestini]|uniref:DeoR/GlpR family DNA-binding transcription regulator n=1 Tax=Muricomes intestini TaxID=1796634 RepID=UPI002FE0D45E
MYTEERQAKILNSLSTTGRIDVNELSSLFQVSRETIRRDLRILERERKLLRTHGGAILPEQAPPVSTKSKDMAEPSVKVRTTLNIQEKEIICKYAATKIVNGDTIFVDNSTTCIHLYQYIPKNMQITFLTNSIAFLVECAKTSCPNHTIVCLGGILKKTNLSIYGNVALENAKQYFPSKAFISCTGITNQSQVTDSGIQEIDIKKTLLSVSEEVYLLADHTKFRPAGQVYLSNLSEMDYIITDTLSDYSYLKLSEEIKNKIHIAI